VETLALQKPKDFSGLDFIEGAWSDRCVCWCQGRSIASRSPQHQRFHRSQQRSEPSTKPRKSRSQSNLEPIVLTGARVYDDFVGTKGDRWLVDRLNTKDILTLSNDQSLPPSRGNPRATVTMSLSFSLELGLAMISMSRSSALS
jgi:hypothetical protein